MTQKSYKFFFNRFVRPYILSIAFLLVLSSSTLLFSFISPLLTKSLIDDVFIGKNTGIFFNILMEMVGLYIISSISVFFSSYITEKLGFVLFKNVAEDSFNVIQCTSMDNIQEIKIGDFLSRIMENIRTAVNIPVNFIPNFIMGVAGIIVPFMIMISLNVQLALIIMSPVFLFIMSSFFFGKRMEKTQMKLLKKNASVFSFLKEHLSMISLIKVFGLESWSQDKFKENMEDYYDKTIYYTKISSLSVSVGSLIFGVPMVLLIGFGGSMVLNGTISLGTFTAFISYVSVFFSPISQLSNLWTSYKSSVPAFDRVKEILELRQDKNGDKELVVTNGIIKFDNVWFSYDNNRHILREFNATFKKGLNYIVGDNGTGKSTILKLICSLYTLNKGSIKIDGQEVVDVKIDDLRTNISMIFSDPYLFDGSIYENIQIGDISSSKSEIIQAAKLVQIHKFIKSLPNGYETQIGENGMTLSSGEKQKIALARAVLKNSPIMLLDEVTKSIDRESREFINKVIKSFENEKTIIIVTHNDNDIESNSNIVYIDQNIKRNLIL